MANLTLWLGAPRFGEEDEVRERAGMTERELAAAERDLYGEEEVVAADHSNGCDGQAERKHRDVELLCTSGRDLRVSSDEIKENIEPKLEDESMAQILDTIDREIAVLPGQDRDAYEEARRVRPESVGREENLLFHRCDPSADAATLASRICHYWEKRRSVFGRDRAFLPMTEDGVMRPDTSGDSDDLSDGLCHGFPWENLARPVGYDRAGRLLIRQRQTGYDPTKHRRIQVMRCMWFLYERILRQTERPGKGFVILYCAVGTQDQRENKIDRKLTKELNEILTSTLPYRFRAYHFINPPWHVRLILPAIRFLMGKEVRQRLVLHLGSKEELAESVERFGIPRQCLLVAMKTDYWGRSSSGDCISSLFDSVNSDETLSLCSRSREKVVPFGGDIHVHSAETPTCGAVMKNNGDEKVVYQDK